jgi:hypothetical protein
MSDENCQHFTSLFSQVFVISNFFNSTFPLPSRANELLAISKLRLRAAVGLLTGHTSLTAHLYKLGPQKSKNASCADMIKKTVYTLCVTVLSQLVKNTGSGAACF